MATEEDEYLHSSELFTGPEGNPMKFRIRPSGTKARLRPLIEHGGGIVTSRPEQDCITVLVEGDKSYLEGCIKAQYIDDCVDKNQLLDFDEYRVKPTDEAKKGTTGQTSSPSTSVVSTTSTVKGRSAYTSEEDEAILSYIARYPESYGGNEVWKKMEVIRVTNHPWQSMRDRFRKKLECHLAGYISKFKEGVLQKYGFTSDSTTSDNAEETDKEKENVNQSNQNRNKNNNQPEIEQMEVESSENDSFDNSLIEAANKPQPDTKKKRAAIYEKGHPVETKNKRDLDPMEKGETCEQMNKTQGKTKSSSNEVATERQPKKLTPRITRSHGATTQNQPNKGDQVQSSKVTRSQQDVILESDVVLEQDDTVQSKVSEQVNIHVTTRSARSKRAASKSQGKHYSSQDAEGEDTDDNSQSSDVRRKTRRGGYRRNKRKRTSPRVFKGSSSSEEEQDVEPTSPKIARFNQSAIDHIIDEKQASPNYRGEEKDSGKNSLSMEVEDDQEDTPMIEVKDSQSFSQNTMGQSIDKETLSEAVQTIKNIMTEFGLSVNAAMYAIHMNTGDIDATLQDLRTGQPPQGCPLWMKEDDIKLNSNDPEDIRKMIKKFGQTEVSSRQRYLDL